ncbi:MAG: type IV pilin-like G/H family protein [Elainellaceae cyanobacterium]
MATEQGFTLIELLVVIIIIGILAAIALPSFLNQAAKAKQAEAKSYVGAAMRAQQTYRIANPEFANSVSQLELGIPSQTADYTYTIPNSASSSSMQFHAISRDASTLRSYAAGVLVRDGLTAAAACQTLAPSSTVPSIQMNINNPNTPRCQGSSEPMR